MKKPNLLKITFPLALLSILCATTRAQDAVKTSPQLYKVLLDNDQVRVLEYRLKPGEKEPMHSHPAGVVYVLSGATLKFSYPGGRTEEKAAATGETIWRDPVTHAVENIGKTEAHALAIDLKK
jgi:quercetin dioxygenase-like cupin family protein